MDLSGAWQTERGGTRSGLYFFRQELSCVWFAGGFSPDGPPTEDLVTVVFDGTLHDDFTITGRWSEVRRSEDIEWFAPLNWGVMTLGIEFLGSGADESIRLHYLRGTPGRPSLDPGFDEQQSWIRVGA